jgi:hypothetical protein
VLRRLCTGRITLDDLWLLIPPALLFVWLGIETIHPADFWWHLRTGQVIVQTGRVPAVDLFTFTRAGQPWTNQAWLTQAALYLLYRVGGLPLILLSFRISIVTGYALVEVASLQEGRTGARSAALAAVCAMLLGHLNWGVRPQAVSFLCFGALVYILERHRARGGRIVWALPALFALWANLHGGFVFGLMLLGIYALAWIARDLVVTRAISAAGRQILLVLGLSILALALNPAGPLGMARYVLGFAQSQTTLAKNLEFLPLSLRERDGMVFFALMAVFIVLVFWRRAALPAYLVAALAVFGFFSLYTRRVLPWFGMMAAPAFALTFASPRPGRGAVVRPGRVRRALNALCLGVILVAIIASLPWVRPLLPRFREGFSYLDTRWTPVAAGEELCRLGPNTRVFNDIAYGGYLSWACPTTPVFMDTRFELYPTDMWKEYLLVANGQYGWEDVLRRYGIDAILADKEEQEILINAAQASGAWLAEYEDSHTALLVRK